MANPNQADIFDNNEGSEHSNDDFEKVEASGGFYNDGAPTQDHDGANAAGAGAFEFEQDAEISTTTDNAGEETEEAPYIAGASEPDAYVHSTDELLDKPMGYEAYNESHGQDDPFRVQPSAPVPDVDNFDPLIDFNSSAGSEVPPSLPTSAPSFNQFEEQIASSIDPPRLFEVEETVDPEKNENKAQSSFQSSEDPTVTAEGCWFKGLDPRDNQGKAEKDERHEKCVDAFHPFLSDLIYWRCPKTTGIVFGGMLVMLISLSIFSLLSVIAYLALATLSVTFSYVTYKKIMAAVQKSGDGHPFKPFLEMDIELREDKLKGAIQQILKNVNATSREVRRLFLIEDFVDSIKFGLLLWLLTYIGAWFNGMTLIIIGLVLVFTLPKIYETYQVQIDNYLGLAKAQVDNVLTIVQSKVPFLKKKEKAQ